MSCLIRIHKDSGIQVGCMLTNDSFIRAYRMVTYNVRRIA